ncbi:MAG TPA: sigma-70 family RNA polymerase sigma factor [Opitutaceae bacterium]|jgi:RNA polymerase sigma-70 factor (ECF subfamily)
MESTPILEKQFLELLRDHRGILLKVAGSFAQEPIDQADLFQDMAVELWNSLPGFEGRSRRSTWIYRVCLNTAMAWRRSRDRRRLNHMPLELVPELDCPSPAPGRRHEGSELLSRMYDAVRTLPASERSLVILLLDGLSYREISEITGLTENHVGVALTRVRKKLSEQLKEVRDEL